MTIAEEESRSQKFSFSLHSVSHDHVGTHEWKGTEILEQKKAALRPRRALVILILSYIIYA